MEEHHVPLYHVRVTLLNNAVAESNDMRKTGIQPLRSGVKAVALPPVLMAMQTFEIAI